MYLGIDLGTSALKLVVLDQALDQIASVSVPLTVATPHPYWSEQNPRDWWHALRTAMAMLHRDQPQLGAQIKAIGLSGQMHGAVLLDTAHTPLRPAILWNDGRSFRESEAMVKACPNIGAIAGVVALPGFTAPKILWLQQHEPDIYNTIAHILLPKDYLGLCLHGQCATDMSDAAGTLWLDQTNRTWSKQTCALSATEPAWLPRLHEGTEITGHLMPSAAACLGLPPAIPIAAGGGDAATGAVGIGAIKNNHAFISLGTSGQLFVATNTYCPNPPKMVHAFAHCVPNMWFQMAAMLNGARPMQWFANIVGHDLSTLLKAAEQHSKQPAFSTAHVPLFLPYLTGERSPHGDAHIRGVFYGLDDATNADILMVSIVQSIAFCFMDAVESFAPTRIDQAYVIGGGAISDFLVQTISNVTNIRLLRPHSAASGPALGAARLASIACGDYSVDIAATAPAGARSFDPQESVRQELLDPLARYRSLYQALRPFAREKANT